MASIANDSNYVFLDEAMYMVDWSTVDYKQDHSEELEVVEGLIWTMEGVIHHEANGREIIDALVEKHWKGHDIYKHVPVVFPEPEPVEVSGVIPEWLVTVARAAELEGNEYFAHNGSLYFIDQKDVVFFPSILDAAAFATDNSSDLDDFGVSHVSYIYELAGILANDKLTNFLSFENQETMNQESFDYLSKKITSLGFGDKLNEDLKANLERGNDRFELNFKGQFNKKDFEATLNFRKSDTKDIYFLNNYRATLTRSDGEKVDQLFYLNKGWGVTAKEAFNLLDGRSVYKELETKGGEKYHAWMQLDFENRDKYQNHEVKQYHDNFGYDLRDAVGKLPVSELDGGDKEKQLLHSLEKGNVQAVNFDIEGAKQPMFIEANPAYKSIHVYDSDMKRVVKEELHKYRKQEPQGEQVKQDVKKEDKKKDLKNEKPDSLLEKKRERKSKGLSV